MKSPIYAINTSITSKSILLSFYYLLWVEAEFGVTYRIHFHIIQGSYLPCVLLLKTYPWKGYAVF